MLDVTLPENLKEINSSAFESTGIENLCLPDTVETVGDNAFHSIKTTIGHNSSNLKNVGNYAFAGMEAKYTTESYLNLLNVGNFGLGINNIKTIYVSKNIVSVGTNAFGSAYYTSICFEGERGASWPNDFVTNSDVSFNVVSVNSTDNFSYAVIKEANEKEYIKILQAYPINNKVLIPSSINGIKVKKINEGIFNLFRNTSEIYTLTLPSAITNIKANTFEKCSKLILCISDANSASELVGWESGFHKPLLKIYYKTSDAGVYEGFEYRVPTVSGAESYAIIEYYRYITEVDELVFPDYVDGYKVTEIGKYGGSSDVYYSHTPEYNYIKYTSVKFPKYLDTIGEYAFANVNTYKEITLPEGLKYIRGYAFTRVNFKHMYIPSTVVSIAYDAIDSDYGVIYNYSKCQINGRYIPTVVESPLEIGTYGKLEYCVYDDENYGRSIEICGYIFDDTESELESFTIPNEINGLIVRKICGRALSKLNTKILYLNPGIRVIEDFAINYETKYVVAENDEMSFGETMFKFLLIKGDNVNNLSLEYSQCIYNFEAFGLYDEITYLVINNNGVREIYYADLEVSSYSYELIIPDEISGMKVTRVLNKFIAKGNEYVETVVLGSNIEYIGEKAFASCNILKSISISKKVTYIGANAFQYCSRLTIYCEWSSKPSSWDENWNSTNVTVYWDIIN